MLNLNFLSLNLFVPCFPPLYTNSGLIPHPKRQSFTLKQWECSVQKRTACPLLSDGPENTRSSAEPAHLRGEMAAAEQVSQPPQNNILCLLQRC